MGVDYERITIVFDARSARMGGNANFVREMPHRLASELKSRGFTLAVLGGPSESLRTRAIRRKLLSVAPAILHTGNRATFAPLGRQVVCVRDRMLVLGSGTGAKRRALRFRLRQLALVHAVAVADSLVVPTDAMREPLERFRDQWKVRNEAPIVVIPHGAPGWEPPPQRPIRSRPRLLYPSHVGEHKNFELLAQVMPSLNDLSPRLTLTATGTERLGDGKLSELFRGAGESTNYRGTVSRERLPELFAEHDVLLFPSKVESFGLPLLEGMVMGMPIVATDADWAREICGDAASYADPDEPLAWERCIRHIVSIGVRRNDLGLERANRFSWSNAAKAYARELTE